MHLLGANTEKQIMCEYDVQSDTQRDHLLKDAALTDNWLEVEESIQKRNHM